MRRYFTGLAISIVALSPLFSLISANAVAQASPAEEMPQREIALTKLFPPLYPPLARQARVIGEVKVQVLIRQDGSISSVEAIAGHALLKQAAIESARNSEYLCRGCRDEVTAYFLTYSFELEKGGNCGDDRSEKAKVTLIKDRVTVASEGTCVTVMNLDPRKRRAAKCLYLWRCGPGLD